MKRKFKIYTNGNIYTINRSQPVAEAVVVNENKIVFTGTLPGAKIFTHGDYSLFDLNGKTMLPGFIDSHLHVLIGARNLSNINLASAKDKKSFQSILREFYQKNKKEWFVGGNWNEENFIDGKLPDKSWIDEIIPNKPVFLFRSDLHMGLANSAALKSANISEKTKNPPGGIIERMRESNAPSGILKDNAMRLALDIFPSYDDDIKEILLDGLKYLTSFGITSVHDLAMEDYFFAYEELFNENRMPARVSYIPMIESVEDFSDFKITGEKYDYYLKRITVKSFADGSLGSSTAWFFDSYSDDPENYGLPTEIFNSGKLKKIALLADNHNVQIMIHAIGDRANHEVLNLLDELNRSNGKRKRRNRIEHCQHLTEDDYSRFAKNKIIASVQPYHLAFDGGWCERRIGKKRLPNTFAILSLAKKNVKLAFGSDWPVVEPSPLKGIAAAVTRKLENSNSIFNKREKISVMQAVEAYTINAAFAEFEENRKGSIEVGKFADFVILDKDIFKIPHEEIKKINISATIVNGKIVTEGNI